MVVGARRAGLSISKTADLHGIFTHNHSRVYRERSEKEKISSERELCGRKCLVDVRGQRRMGRLIKDDRKATVTQITTRYNQGMQNTISERTTRRTMKQINEWMNEWCIYIVLFCVLLYTQSALQSCKGGLSWTTTSVQHPLGWCDSCHRTMAPVRSPHTSYRWRGERDSANQVDGDY